MDSDGVSAEEVAVELGLSGLGVLGVEELDQAPILDHALGHGNLEKDGRGCVGVKYFNIRSRLILHFRFSGREKKSRAWVSNFPQKKSHFLTGKVHPKSGTHPVS